MLGRQLIGLSAVFSLIIAVTYVYVNAPSQGCLACAVLFLGSVIAVCFGPDVLYYIQQRAAEQERERLRAIGSPLMNQPRRKLHLVIDDTVSFTRNAFSATRRFVRRITGTVPTERGPMDVDVTYRHTETRDYREISYKEKPPYNSKQIGL